MNHTDTMKLAIEALAVKFSEGWHEGIKIDASDIMLLNDAAQALAEQPAQQEPVDFASLLREAEEIVRGKPTWKRFIDGTPLSNDIAVWMTVFAQDFARRTSPQPAQRKPCQVWDAKGYDALCQELEGWKARAQRKPLTDEEIIASNYPDGKENGPTIAAPDFELVAFARQIEAAHDIKEKT